MTETPKRGMVIVVTEEQKAALLASPDWVITKEPPRLSACKQGGKMERLLKDIMSGTTRVSLDEDAKQKDPPKGEP